MASEEGQAQTAPPTTSAPETSGIQQLPAQPNRDPAAETLTCQWVGCGERCTNAEQLYEHVCERHVGRKSTNNLNLTCQWGACRTTTVKRDHITSHMRVHVPLKPHKCDFCGKSFKRPQDLKKHVKTHADDSVLMRSPDSNMNNNQNGQNGFPADNKAYYSGHEMNGGYPPASGAHVGGNNFNSYPNPSGAYSGYGQVNYPGTTLADQQSMDTRRRAIEALNDFLGDVKRRALDPHAYYDVGSRLNAQSLPLPVSIGAGYSIGSGYNGNAAGNAAGNGHNASFGSVHSMLDSFTGGNGGGGIGHAGALAQNYQLPLSNARTKGDLLDIDRFLEQLSATVYESSNQSAAAGVQQPGVHTQLPGYNFNNYHRTSNSPPQSQHHVNAAASSAGVQPLSSVAQMASMTASAQGMDTPPALTPASVSSYASSGHSPMSSHSRSSGDGASMYPQLPSVTSMSDMGSGYSSAPASGLASGFDGYDSRRYSGGRLQREAPARRGSDAMEIDSEGQRTPRKMSIAAASKRPTSSSNVDPALRSTPTGDSPAASPQSDTTDDKAQEAWVENVRVIEQLRNWIRDRLEGGDFEKDENSTPEPADHGISKIAEENAKHDEEENAPVAYPTLKMEA